MKVGIFDSGIGGMSVLQAIEAAMLPEVETVFASDKEHMPYGDKPPVEILGYVIPILERLVADGCRVLVIACNTVTTYHITALRERFSVPIIGIEPMVKPAVAMTKTGAIAVCATPATLASPRYAWLKQTYAYPHTVTVLEPDCSRWAYMIEHDRINELQLDDQVADIRRQGADVIVLGCTHYHWIEEEIRRVAGPQMVIIQPEAAVVKRLRRVLEGLARPE